MNVTWYIARRYFKGSNRESRFLSFIKIMAITGVAVGSAGLLIALAIVHGFKSAINEKIIGFAPHVTVSTFGAMPIQRADTLELHLAAIDGVQRVEPAVLGQVMIQSANDISGTILKGLRDGGDVTELETYIVEGRYSVAPDEEGFSGIVLGSALADLIGASVGDKVTVFALDGLPTPLNTPEIEQYRVQGIYQTGIDRFDDNFAVTDIRSVRNLLGMRTDQATTMEIQVRSIQEIPQVYSTIRTASIPYVTENIYQRYRNIFAWVDLQEETIPFVISVMIIVAAFNLIGTILMMVLERVRDIGILKTMGARSRAIRKIFLIEGFFVALTGLIIGMGIALLFMWLQLEYSIIPLSEENYYMSTAPVEPQWIDFVIVPAVTIALCMLASWLPARFAAKTDPVKVLAFGR
ncbi:MAG: FtsX-like permease family protein [Balneolaceae bacterium]